MANDKSTARPWRVRGPVPGKLGGWEIHGAEGLIAMMQHHPAKQDAARADAEFIVSACNAAGELEQLRAALAPLHVPGASVPIPSMRTLAADFARVSAELEQLRAALATVNAERDGAQSALALARDALNAIAAWRDGPVVNGSFDNPGDAQSARDALAKINAAHAPALASDADIKRARDDYACDDIAIDDGAHFSACDDGAGWVQAWVYIGPTA